MINCLNEQDNKLRFLACEALYNLIKVIRIHALEYLPELFNHLIKMSIDVDIDVKNGSEILNKLLIDIVTEAQELDFEMIKNMIREHIYVVQPQCRQFVILWLSLINSKNNIETIKCLPFWMDGILNIYTDKTNDIRRFCGSYLNELLKLIEDMYLNHNFINLQDLLLLMPILISNMELSEKESILKL